MYIYIYYIVICIFAPNCWKIIRKITNRMYENQNSECNFIKNLAPLCAGLIGAKCMKLFQLSDKLYIFSSFHVKTVSI